MFNRDKIKELESKVKFLESHINMLEDLNRKLTEDLQNAGFRFQMGDEVCYNLGFYLVTNRKYWLERGYFLCSKRQYILTRKGEQVGWIDESELRRSQNEM